MKIRLKIVHHLCKVVSILLLCGGFAGEVPFLFFIVFLLMVLAWCIADYWKIYWLSCAGLIINTSISAIGLLKGGPSWLLIPGGTLALFCWVLEDYFYHVLNSSDKAMIDNSAIELDILKMGLCLIVGMIFVVIASSFRFHFPFVIVFLIGLVLIASLFKFIKGINTLTG